MFNTGLITRGLSLTKIIDGISKTLQIANQMIPLYQRAKPMIQNARTIMSTLKNLTSSSSKDSSNKIIKSNTTPKNTSTSLPQAKKIEKNSPTFFL